MASSGVPSGGSNNPPPSLRVPSTSNPATEYRRLSYANVAAGSTAATRTARLNALRRTAANEPNSAAPSPSREESRGSMEVDNNNAAEDPLGWDGAGVRAKSSKLGGDGMGCLIHSYHHPFFIPSYLRRTRYAQMLRQQHDEHLAELRERNSPGSSSGSGQVLNSPLSATASAYAKLTGSQLPRAVIQDIVERIKLEDDGSDRVERHKSLPSRWAENDAQPGLEILAEGSEVRFNGVTKTTDEAASVRSDFCMPKECGLYYYEVTVLSRSKDGLIGVGFSGSRVSLNRLPGWENNSWAYHGDDGYSFACTASGKSYGPKFASQDVVGCGVNFRTRSAFFTKNGVYLGVAFTNIKLDDIHPSVGMKRPGENLRVNFGQKPFVFDIDRLMEQERAAMIAEIDKTDVRLLHPPDDERALIHKLVSQYFAHEGFVETAKAFVKDMEADQTGLDIGDSKDTRPPVCQIDEEEDVHAFNRQKIRRAILDGDIDRALKFTNSFYPHVLEEERNRDISFRLRCRKFIEMMRRYAELQTSTSSGSHSPEQAMARSVQSLASNRGARIDPIMAQNIGNDSAHPVEDTQMELDEQLHREIAPKNPTSEPGDEEDATEEENEDEDEDDEDDEEDVDMDGGAPTTDPDPADNPSPKATLMKQHDLLTAALEYGQSLQSAFGNDPRPHVKKQLEDVFAIMAYTDPAASVVGGLLDPQGRTAIAEEVNGAILVSLGKAPAAALERIIMQTEYMLDETAARFAGPTAFVNARGDFLSP